VLSGEILPGPGKILLSSGEMLPESGEPLLCSGEPLPDTGEPLPDSGEQVLSDCQVQTQEKTRQKQGHNADGEPSGRALGEADRRVLRQVAECS